MTNITGDCPVCDGKIIVPTGTEVSEIINCPECKNQMVVKEITADSAVFDEAPEVEEDWGE